MFRVLLISAAVLLVAGSAASAQSATTRCRPTYAGAPQLGMTCDTDSPAARTSSSSGAAPVYSWKDVPPTPCSKLQAMASGSNYCEARQIAATRKGVGELIAAGKCDEALKAALGTGDIEFAREVRDFCAPKP